MIKFNINVGFNLRKKPGDKTFTQFGKKKYYNGVFELEYLIVKK